MYDLSIYLSTLYKTFHLTKDQNCLASAGIERKFFLLNGKLHNIMWCSICPCINMSPFFNSNNCIHSKNHKKIPKNPQIFLSKIHFQFKMWVWWRFRPKTNRNSINDLTSTVLLLISINLSIFEWFIYISIRISIFVWFIYISFNLSWFVWFIYISVTLLMSALYVARNTLYKK